MEIVGPGTVDVSLQLDHVGMVNLLQCLKGAAEQTRC